MHRHTVRIVSFGAPSLFNKGCVWRWISICRLGWQRAITCAKSLGWNSYCWWPLLPYWSEASKMKVFLKTIMCVHGLLNVWWCSKLTLVRGDWKWLKEIFDMKHFWKHNAGICFKCATTKKAGPYQLLWLIIRTLFKTVDWFNLWLVAQTKTCSADARFSKRKVFESIPRLSTDEFFRCALQLGWLFTMFTVHV